jgi:hypothetical protein
MISISPEQMRLVHALARQCGEGHEHIRDRAASKWDIGSLKDLTMAQARVLIDEYQSEITPPAPVQPPERPRFTFASLPKKAAAKPAGHVSKPVTRPSGGDLMPPSFKPRFDPRFGISDEMAEIPF